MHAVPTVFRTFRNDHRRVLLQLDALERVIARGERRARLGPRAEAVLREMVAMLGRQFATHMAAEDQLLYPALAEALPESAASLEPLAAEHHEMRGMLARLTSLLEQTSDAARDEQIVVQAQDLVDLLRIHIRKEEAAVFNVAARMLTSRELERISSRIAAHRPPPTRSRTARTGTKGNRT